MYISFASENLICVSYICIFFDLICNELIVLYHFVKIYFMKFHILSYSFSVINIKSSRTNMYLSLIDTKRHALKISM